MEISTSLMSKNGNKGEPLTNTYIPSAHLFLPLPSLLLFPFPIYYMSYILSCIGIYQGKWGLRSDDMKWEASEVRERGSDSPFLKLFSYSFPLPPHLSQSSNFPPSLFHQPPPLVHIPTVVLGKTGFWISKTSRTLLSKKFHSIFFFPTEKIRNGGGGGEEERKNVSLLLRAPV